MTLREKKIKETLERIESICKEKGPEAEKEYHKKIEEYAKNERRSIGEIIRERAKEIEEKRKKLLEKAQKEAKKEEGKEEEYRQRIGINLIFAKLLEKNVLIEHEIETTKRWEAKKAKQFIKRDIEIEEIRKGIEKITEKVGKKELREIQGILEGLGYKVKFEQKKLEEDEVEFFEVYLNKILIFKVKIKEK